MVDSIGRKFGQTARHTATASARRARLLMLAIGPVAALLAIPAMGASLTWDPLHNGVGSDTNGSWDVLTNNWATGTSDTVWLNDGTASAVLGVSGAATVTISVPTINALGVTFNQGYSLAAAAGDSLTIGTGGVTVAAGQNPTISAPIAGSSGLAIVSGTGSSLILSGVNSYTGTTSLIGATTVSAGGNLGNATNGLIFGGANTTAVASLSISSNLIVGSLLSTTSGGSNVLTLNNNATFTDTGAFTLGLTLITAGIASNTSLTVNTDGSNTTLNLTNSNNTNFTLGSRNSGAGAAVAETGYLNVANVTNFVYNTGTTGTGNFLVGQGTRSVGTFVGAQNNAITAANVIVGDSSGDTGNFNNGGTSNLALGGGNNTINTNRIILGAAKSGGTLTFTGAGGTLSISGQAGGNTTTDILVGSANISGGNDTGTSTLSLAGHSVSIQAGTLTVSSMTGGGSASTVPGIVTFDTGTFNVANLILANNASGAATVGPNANVTIGGSSPNATATGVFNVTNSFLLENNTNTATTSVGNGTMTINGGTVNSSVDILRVGKGNTTLTLNGGTLNMNGHAIGSAAAIINTVNFANGPVSPTLLNLGGTGVNGVGLTAGGSATLILAGNNSYSGGTTVTTSLQVGSATQSGNLPSGGAVVNNGTLTFAGSGTSSIGNLSGSGAIQSNAGTVLVGDSSTNFAGPVTISGGTFGGVGTLGTVNLNSGTLQAGASGSDTSGVLNIGTLTVSGGSLGFNIGGGTASSMSVGSISALPALTFSIVGSVTNGTQYTILTDSGALPAGTLSPVSVGRSTVTPSKVGNTLVATVTGTGPASLFYRNQSGNGQFDVHGSQNFLNGASADFFFAFDNVAFDDTNTTSHTVTLPGTVTPTSITVTTASNYTFTGTGSIGGNGTLTVNGGTVILGTANNTYSGATSVASGTLQLAATGALPTGGALSVSSGATLDLNGNAASVSSLAGSGTVRNTSTAAPATFTLAGSGASTFAGAFSTTAGAQPLSVAISSGNLTLTGASSYVGATTIAGGAGLTLGNGGTTGSLSATTAIANGGTLTFNNSALVTIPNNITGIGQISLAGSNALTFTGNLSFGSLNIAGGSIQLGTGGATTVTGTGPIVNNGSLIVNDATNVTLSGAISGTGSVVQNGPGNLTLSSVSTYSGGATVAGGSLIVSGSGGSSALGSGNVNVNAGGTLVGNNADSFGYFGNNGSPGTININGGTVTDRASATYRVTLPNLVFTGGMLTNAAGATGDSNGQFSLQGPQTTAFVAGPVSITTNAASTTAVISATTVSIQTALTFNIAAGSTASGVDMLVTSNLKNYTTTVQPVVVNGPGTLALAGNSTFTGGITVASGTLQVGSASDTAALATPLGGTTGAVVNNSIIKFGSSQAATVANAITGTGSVIVSSGIAVLNGASSYAGPTTLNGGTLAGTGSITSAVVAGSGPHTINVGLPGSVGTLTVGGLSTNANSTLAFDLAAPSGTNDLLAVNGDVAINGGKLAISSQTSTGNSSLGYYKVLTYTGNLTGSTSGIVLPAVDANNIAYTLDTTHDANAIDVHRGFVGDATDDGVVDLNDLNVVLNNLGVATRSWNSGNFDGAATIDLNDLNSVLNHLGTSVPAGAGIVAAAEALVAGAASPSAVPEPASLAMLGLGGALLLRRRRLA